MDNTTLGTRGPAVFPIGLGCMGMSEFYGESDDARSIGVIHRMLERLPGRALLDTADMYGSGHNESLIGRAIADRRDRAVIATKFAILRGEGGSFAGISGRPEYVAPACDASLKRLGIETIDLYYQHRVDPQVPIEDTVGAMATLVEAGKVRHLGLSEAAPATVRRAHAVHPIAAVQTEYSLWSRDPEGELLETCKELGIALVGYSPLGRGFLSGTIRSVDDLAADDFRRGMPRFSADNLPRNLALADAVQQLARAKGCTPAQLALAWLLARDESVIAIPGTRSIARLEENLDAVKVELSTEDRARIDGALPHGAAAGDRYSAAQMAAVNG